MTFTPTHSRPFDPTFSSLAPANGPARPLLLALILLLHVLAVWLWLHAGGAQRKDPAARAVQRVLLRLLPSPLAESVQPAAPQRRAPQAIASTAARPAPAQARRPTANSPAAITLPPATPAAQAIQAMPADVPAPAAALPAPLDLRLPRAASAPRPAPSATPASLARGDPRANTARRNFGERLGDALGTDDRVVEEDLGGGRSRIRQGASCVEVHQTRDAQLDPFSQSTRPVPRGVKNCN